MRHHLVAPLLVDEGEVVAVDWRCKHRGVARSEVPRYERLDLRIVRAKAKHDNLVLRNDAAHGPHCLVVDGGRRLRPVEVVQVEYGQDVVVFDECNLLTVKAPDETRRLDTALPFTLDGKNQLRKHPIDIRRVVLRLGPENRCVRNEHHLARVTALRQHAEVDVANNASAVVLAEEQGGDAVLQLLFADGGLTIHSLHRHFFHSVPFLRGFQHIARCHGSMVLGQHLSAVFRFVLRSNSRLRSLGVGLR